MAIIVEIFPALTRLEEVARHRAKLRHGVAKHEETQFIANPNPPNTVFDLSEHTSISKRAKNGLQHGHMASIPPQHYNSKRNTRLWSAKHTPTYVGADFDPEPKDPSIGIPLDLDNPEVLEAQLDIEILVDQLKELGCWQD